MKAILLIVPLLGLTMSAHAADLKSQIDVANQKWIVAYNKGDAAAVAALYTEHAAVLPPGHDLVRGHEAIQTFFNGAIQSGFKVTALHSMSVEQYGDAAREIGSVSGQMPDANKQMTNVEGKYVVVWKRVNNSWKLDSDIWNLNR
jgi:uncharacterized protein (TIGR02246 family)